MLLTQALIDARAQSMSGARDRGDVLVVLHRARLIWQGNISQEPDGSGVQPRGRDTVIGERLIGG